MKVILQMHLPATFVSVIHYEFFLQNSFSSHKALVLRASAGSVKEVQIKKYEKNMQAKLKINQTRKLYWKLQIG